ncbi:MAG: glycosyltransferase family 39 protein, partial [Desulfuromonadaceae bacterium]
MIKDWYEKTKLDLVPVMLLLLAAFMLYGKGLGQDFLENWDDHIYVTANPDIMGFTLENIRYAFTKEYVGNYAPLHIISYILDYTLWGFNALGFKLTNILLHATNAILYYATLARITGRYRFALAAAAIFLCHPVQVESVVWISQRKNLLAMFFFLLSFLTYLSWREHRRFALYALSLAAFTLSLLSKSAAVVLPLILICYDICFRERETLWRLVRDKLPYIGLAVTCSLVALYTQEGSGRTGYLSGTPLITLINMLPTFSRYLILLLVPAQLSIIYNEPIKTVLDTEVILSALLVVILTISWVYLYRQNRVIFFWCSLIPIGLLPVSNIIPLVTLMNDRYLYFPMLGFAAIVAHLLISEPGIRPSRQLIPLRIVYCAVLLALSAVTWKRVDVWQDSVTLWSDAVIKSRDGFRYGPDDNFIAGAYGEALHILGYQAERCGSIQAARNYYLKALAWDPLDPLSRVALNNLSGIYVK